MAETPSISQLMQEAADQAAELARSHFETDLDFSEESLQAVERILAAMYSQIPRGRRRSSRRGPSHEQMMGAAYLWGGYIGEVIRRRWGGEWKLETEAFPGEGVPTLRIGGIDLHPSVKVWKRLTNGAEDDVWFYYQTLCSLLKREESGRPPGDSA